MANQLFVVLSGINGYNVDDLFYFVASPTQDRTNGDKILIGMSIETDNRFLYIVPGKYQTSKDESILTMDKFTFKFIALGSSDASAALELEHNVVYELNSSIPDEHEYCAHIVYKVNDQEWQGTFDKCLSLVELETASSPSSSLGEIPYLQNGTPPMSNVTPTPAAPVLTTAKRTFTEQVNRDIQNAQAVVQTHVQNQTPVQHAPTGQGPQMAQTYNMPPQQVPQVAFAASALPPVMQPAMQIMPPQVPPQPTSLNPFVMLQPVSQPAVSNAVPNQPTVSQSMMQRQEQVMPPKPETSKPESEMNAAYLDEFEHSSKKQKKEKGTRSYNSLSMELKACFDDYMAAANATGNVEVRASIDANGKTKGYRVVVGDEKKSFKTTAQTADYLKEKFNYCIEKFAKHGNLFAEY